MRTHFGFNLYWKWTLTNVHGKQHEVQFNESVEMPLITTGWAEMGEVYNITSSRKNHFGFVGDGQFKIGVFNNPPNGTTPAIPRWHSEYALTPDRNFIVTLSRTHATAYHLVYLFPLIGPSKKKPINKFCSP